VTNIFRSFYLEDGGKNQQAHRYGTKITSLSPCVKSKGSQYSITKGRIPQLIPVLGSQLAGDVSHKPGGRLPLLSARPAVTLATLKRAATNFAAWWTEEARWTVCPRLSPDSVATAIWTQALLCLSSTLTTRQATIRYDTRCYFNVRLKSDMSQLNLPHGTNN